MSPTLDGGGARDEGSTDKKEPDLAREPGSASDAAEGAEGDALVEDNVNDKSDKSDALVESKGAGGEGGAGAHMKDNAKDNLGDNKGGDCLRDLLEVHLKSRRWSDNEPCGVHFLGFRSAHHTYATWLCGASCVRRANRIWTGRH